MKTPTNTNAEDCQERFVLLASQYGYKKAWRYLHQEFDASVCADMATQGKTKDPEGQRESTAEGRKASSKWSALFENTEGRR